MRTRPESRTVEVGGLDLHYLLAADAPAQAPVVVLVHGLGLSTASMVPLADALAPGYRVLVPDLPGYGRSEDPAHLPTVPQLADSLDGFAAALDLAPAVFVGSSLGAQVVANLAARHPERVTAAVLVGPTRDPSAPTPLRQALRLLRDVPHERPSLVPLATLSYLRAGPRRMWQLLASALRRSVEQGLPHIDVPVLIVRGAHDPVAGQDWVESMNRLIPDSRLVVLPGAGHAPNYSQPVALATAIRTFLAD